MVKEYFYRNAGNVAWINDTFKKAEAAGAPAIVFAYQADPMFGMPHDMEYANSGFHDALDAFARNAAAFKKPVLLVNCDSHVLVIDQPLVSPGSKKPLENVYRLQVMGSSQVEGVRVTVDTEDPAVFGFKPLIVPQNLDLATA